MRKRINLIFSISILLAALIITAALFHHAQDAGNVRRDDIVYDESLLSFDTNWKIIENGSVVSEAPVPGITETAKGGSVVISNTLPASVTGGTYLAFMGADSFVTAYIGGEEVYSSPAIRQRGRLTPLPGWIFIPLEAEYSLKRISLLFTYPYGSSSGILPKILIGTHSEVLLYASYSAYTSLYIGISMVALGILVLIFALATPSIEGMSQSFTCLCLFISALGLVLINQAGIPRMDNDIYYAEYISSNLIIRVLPVLHSMHMYFSVSREREKKAYLFIFAFSFAFFALSALLHFIGVWDLSASLYPARALMLLELFISFCFYVKEAGKGRGEAKAKTGRICSALSAIGILFLMAGIGAGMLGRRFSLSYASSFKCLGALVFALLGCASIIIMAYRNTFDKLVLANEITKSRVSLMISQIQPHFIYNTLNAIMAMVKQAPDKAYNTISDFSKYLRYNINALSSVELIPFSEELKHIKVYMDIEKERFGKRVDIVYDIGDDDFVLPPLSVQPFVENAVKHGVCKKSEGGTVRLSTSEDRDFYIVTIEDDGAGFDTSLLESDKRGVGIKNTMYRLKTLADAETNIESEKGKGTKVTIRLPKDRRFSIDENYNS